MPISVPHIAVLVTAATLWGPRADAGICVDVDVHSTTSAVSRATAAALEREAAAIWRPYGVDLHWPSSPCALADASFDVLIAPTLPHATDGAPVLGRTHVELTPVEHVPILIDYGTTERTIATLTVGALAAEIGVQRVGPREMGRALGRILAHEIGHVLLAMSQHQRHGLMRESYQAIDMLYPLRAQYGLSSEERARLRERFQWMAANRSGASPDPGGNPPDQRDREPGIDDPHKTDR